MGTCTVSRNVFPRPSGSISGGRPIREWWLLEPPKQLYRFTEADAGGGADLNRAAARSYALDWPEEARSAVYWILCRHDVARPFAFNPFREEPRSAERDGHRKDPLRQDHCPLDRRLWPRCPPQHVGAVDHPMPSRMGDKC